MRIPASTYRLQIHSGFTLQDAAAIVEYLHELGVDWVYVSPLLTAEAGSTHGYDVTDPTTVDPERGGAQGLAELSRAVRAKGMGLLVDIVPNHVGVASAAQNPWWWSLLKHGRNSKYADYFDVDWEAGGGRLLLPVLGEDDAANPPVELVAAEESPDGPGSLELSYYEHRFPVADGTTDGTADNPADVLARQHYQLVNWRRADTDLNYRRFFAVNTLAGLRVEDPAVYEAAHAEVRRWVREGLIDGLRIDHPDGLAAPGDYLDRLADTSDNAYVVVEKILEPGEQLPPDWACTGTSGYDALAAVDRLFVDPDGQGPLENIQDKVSGGNPPSYPDLIHTTKRWVADGMLNSEIRRLARLVPAAVGPDPAALDLALRDPAVVVDALAELAACFPVYRSYLPFGQEYLDHAVREAGERRPDLEDAVTALHPLLGDVEGPGRTLAVRFQQTTGMVMAKGVEDTAFYRYNRLVSLNEVGADPSIFSLTVAEFHEAMAQRLNTRPYAMTTLSTHDTKRSEDTRARISVLSELPDYWEETLGRLMAAAPLPDGGLANLLWQSILGVWPAPRERLQGYALKAAREAAKSTTWTDPVEEFEEPLRALVDAAFDHPNVTAVLAECVETIKAHGWSNSLSAKLVQLTMPGVPDVYQGTELWDYSLTDPDNRRPVDYSLRQQLLESQGTEAPDITDDGAAKQRVVSTALRVRRDNPELFEGYVPLAAVGPAAGHLVAFDRGGAVSLATRLPVGLAHSGGWDTTVVDLPEGLYVDAVTGRRFNGGQQSLGAVLDVYPVALLIRQGTR